MILKALAHEGTPSLYEFDKDGIAWKEITEPGANRAGKYRSLTYLTTEYGGFHHVHSSTFPH